MFKLFFIAAVVVAVPFFFIFTWLISSYHRLATLRQRATGALQAGEAAGSASEGSPNPISIYNQARQTFPMNIIASVLGFGEIKREA